MNTAQTIYTVFFAINWGIVSNVLPRWKPFHYALLFHPGFSYPKRRIVVGWILLNLIPWIFFTLDLFWLRGDDPPIADRGWWWTVSIACLSILPGLAPFGCYRLWVFLMHSYPDYFYAANHAAVQKAVPQAVNDDFEPNKDKLGLGHFSMKWDFIVGFIYVACAFLPTLKLMLT